MRQPTLYHKTLTSADTEYSQELPANTTSVEVRLQDSTAFRLAWVTGKVATPTAPYLTVPAGHKYTRDGMDGGYTYTVYLATDGTSKTAEIETWKD